MERRIAISLILAASGALATGLTPVAALPAENGTKNVAQTDFDFWVGDWKQKNRRLATPLSGANDWYEFDSTSSTRHLWGGLANMDEFLAPQTPVGPISGMTLRLYDPKSNQWRIYWASANSARIGAPTIGSFADGRGEFFDQEDFNGRSILVRYTWLNLSPATSRWEQAFSQDFGKTWETNWIMENTRV
jgi:hypothetical protein